MAEIITNNLKQFDANDPVKYDFAMFAFGVESKKRDNSNLENL